MFEDRRSLIIKSKKHKTTIRFCVSMWAVIVHIALLSVFAGAIPAAFVLDFSGDRVVAVLSSVALVGVGISFAMLFLRKLIIDSEKRLVRYFSLFGETFRFNETAAMYGDRRLVEGAEGGGSYHKRFAVIKTKNDTMKFEVLTEEQSKQLIRELREAMNKAVMEQNG